MARTNVDDDWFADITGRRAALILAVSAKPRNIAREADGTALTAWRLAQRYWKKGNKRVPIKEWDKHGLDAMIEAGLAEITPRGVYVAGSREYFKWLQERASAGKKGGTKSVASRKAKNLLENQTVTDTEKLKQIEANPSNSNPLPLITINSLPLSLVKLTPNLNTGGGIINSRAHARYDLPPLKKLELMATEAVSKVIACLHSKCEGETHAEEMLGPAIWKILRKKYPSNTWRLWGGKYDRMIDKGKAEWFEVELQKHVEAHIQFLEENLTIPGEIA